MFLLGIVASTTLFAQSYPVKVEAGAEFTIVLRSDGTLWSYGYNGNGQLGQGHNETADEPVRVGQDSDWQDVAAGAVHCLAIKTDGTLWAWGGNGVGQLGTGNTTDVNEPVQIGTATDWERISAGMGHSMAIRTDGTLWSWGYNTYGQLGIGGTDQETAPVQVGTGSDWKEISAGGAHSMAIRNDGTLWCWGFNGTGQAGIVGAQIYDTPQQVGVSSAWKSVSAGLEFSMALDAAGSVYSWGFNGNDQLGQGIAANQVNEPAMVTGLPGVRFIAAGSTFAFAIDSTDALYGWGFNVFGQLGNGSTTQQDVPQELAAGETWSLIAAADGLISGGNIYGYFSVGIKTNDVLVCATGLNATGQLGTGGTANEDTFSCYDWDSSIGIKEHETLPFELFPNPSKGTVSLRIYDERLAGNSASLYDTEGKKVKVFVITGMNDSYDLSDIRKGVYLLRIDGVSEQIPVRLVLQ